jgi:hypothetical protein
MIRAAIGAANVAAHTEGRNVRCGSTPEAICDAPLPRRLALSIGESARTTAVP